MPVHVIPEICNSLPIHITISVETSLTKQFMFSNSKRGANLPTVKCLKIIVFVDFMLDSHIILQGYFAHIYMNIHRKHWIHIIVGAVCDYYNI